MEAQEYGKIIAQILNAGFDPYSVNDSVGKNHYTRKEPKLFIHDFDCFVPANEENGCESLPTVQTRINRTVYQLNKNFWNTGRLKAIHSAILQHLKSESAKQTLIAAIAKVNSK